LLRRWILRVGITLVIILFLAITGALYFTYVARRQAERYIRAVRPLRIGATYESIAKQMSDADLPAKLSSTDCQIDGISKNCVGKLFDDKWMTRFHLAPASGIFITLYFEDGKLSSKLMTIVANTNDGVGDFASVTENATVASEIFLHDRHKLSVHLSAMDFSGFRTNAYDLNVSCIGSIKGCTADQYLPAISELERTSPK
jgi:hypothetical protein